MFSFWIERASFRRTIVCMNSFEGDILILCELWREALTGHKVSHPPPCAQAEALTCLCRGDIQLSAQHHESRRYLPSHIPSPLSLPCQQWQCLPPQWPFGMGLLFHWGGITDFHLLPSLCWALVRWLGQIEPSACPVFSAPWLCYLSFFAFLCLCCLVFIASNLSSLSSLSRPSNPWGFFLPIICPLSFLVIEMSAPDPFSLQCLMGQTQPTLI